MRCLRAVKSAARARGLRAARRRALHRRRSRRAVRAPRRRRAVPLPAPARRGARLPRSRPADRGAAARGADAVWPGWGFVAEDPEFVERVAAEGMRFLGPPAQAMRRSATRSPPSAWPSEPACRSPPWSGGAVATTRTRRAVRRTHRLSAGAQGVRRRRRTRHPHRRGRARRCRRRSRRGRRGAAAFGDGRLFLERMVAGGAPHRGADRRRRARARARARLPRLLGAAPPPEGDRGGAAAGARAAAAARRSQPRRCAWPARSATSGLGTVEFLVARRAVLLPRDEPAAAGRARRHRGDHRPRPGRAADPHRARRALRRPRAPPSAASPSRRACAPRIPTPASLPAPGRIARFDPALGPRLRVDTGVVAGSVVPAAFDSLIAKVIATRRDARARRGRGSSARSRDFDLVIEGGATQQGLPARCSSEPPSCRAGGVDTGWLDRSHGARGAARPYAVEALVAAAILAYQRARAATRALNFFADTTTIARDARAAVAGPARSTSPIGGARYRLHVFAIGAWRYRVHFDGRADRASRCARTTPHAARLVIGRTLRDPRTTSTDAGVRLEVEGRVHRFGWADRRPGAAPRAGDGGRDRRRARASASTPGSASACSRR